MKVLRYVAAAQQLSVQSYAYKIFFEVPTILCIQFLIKIYLYSFKSRQNFLQMG